VVDDKHLCEELKHIEVFYNREPLHSSNDYMSPEDYESER